MKKSSTEIKSKQTAFDVGRIVSFFRSLDVEVEVKRYRRGLSIYIQPGKISLARLVPVGNGDHVEILWWSHRNQWMPVGDFGGVVMPANKALQYIMADENQCFGSLSFDHR